MYDEEKLNSKPSLIIVSIIVILLIASLYNAGITSYNRMTQAQKNVLSIGVNTPFAPFEYRQGENFVGFDIELAEKIGEKLGRNIKIVDFTEFSTIFPALENNKINMSISAITITSDRKEIFSFSDPYYNTNQALLILKSNDLKISSTNLSIEDFRNLKLGVQEKTTSQSWIESNINDKSFLLPRVNEMFAIVIGVCNNTLTGN